MKILTSWRTSLAGGIPGLSILFLQASYLLDSDPKTIFDISVVLGAISAILLGLAARDNAVTSKQAGAK
jgi:hypothetical protein